MLIADYPWPTLWPPPVYKSNLHHPTFLPVGHRQDRAMDKSWLSENIKIWPTFVNETLSGDMNSSGIFLICYLR